MNQEKTAEEKLLIAFYKARQKKLRSIEESRGPVSEGEKQTKLTVDLGSAQPFLDDPSDDLIREAEALTNLIRRGWLEPVGDPSTRGLYSMAKFKPVGMRQARELTES